MPGGGRAAGGWAGAAGGAPAPEAEGGAGEQDAERLQGDRHIRVLGQVEPKGERDGGHLEAEVRAERDQKRPGGDEPDGTEARADPLADTNGDEEVAGRQAALELRDAEHARRC